MTLRALNLHKFLFRLVNELSRVSSGGGVQPDPAGYESSS